jgi:heme-degrading monooxygenase HmoA
MFARINEITWLPDVDQAALQQATDQWRELIRNQAGHLGHLTIDRGEGHVVTITLWASPEAAQGWSDNSAFRRLTEERLRPLLAEWRTSEGPVVSAELSRAGASAGA